VPQSLTYVAFAASFAPWGSIYGLPAGACHLEQSRILPAVTLGDPRVLRKENQNRRTISYEINGAIVTER